MLLQTDVDKSAKEISTSCEKSGDQLPEKTLETNGTVSVAMETEEGSVRNEKVADVPVVDPKIDKDEAKGKPDILVPSDKMLKEHQDAVKVKKPVKSEKSSTMMTLDAILNLQQQMLRPGEKIKEESE
jgi:hypothetical protein